ncbi:MAG TPA: fibronectin type III domain-containing protein [Chthonomonadaceae bacterium]|nr:fibronectin type III domain-containing protein [Chthonomonadaceae bacterium]
MQDYLTASGPGARLLRGGKRLRNVLLALTTLVSLPALLGQAHAQVPDLGIGASLNGKQVFPSDNPWNQDISQMPVDPNSATLIASIGLNTNLHPDFGTFWNGNPIGIPYIVVPGTQALVPISFTYSGESDPGPYPIPANAPIEGGANSTGDRHVIVIDRDNWILYETWNSWPQPDGSWQAGSGAIFNLNSDALRPQGWTSADAAGLPIFPGLVRYDEVIGQGVINHALRFTVAHTRRAYTYPARHLASTLTDPSYPPMGMRVRLKANFDISGYPAGVQVILTALKKYGMFVADNGSNWFLSGAHDPNWDDNMLSSIKSVPGSAFEVVQMGDIITDTVAPPANLTAAAGNGGVTLNWSASAGALSYNVKSASTALGPFTTVTNVAGTTATVNGLTNGTTYYFVVTAVNVTGQSLNSNVVNATPAGAAQTTLSNLSLSAPSAIGGNSLQGTVKLSSPAPTGGVVVALSSNNSALASVPATVTVAAGATTASFTVQSVPVDQTTTATINASYNGVNQSASFQVTTPSLQAMALSPSGAQGGKTITGAVVLSGKAGPSGCVVTLSSNNIHASVPPSVKVPAGARGVTFSIPTSAVTASTNVSITGTYGSTYTAILTLTP